MSDERCLSKDNDGDDLFVVMTADTVRASRHKGWPRVAVVVWWCGSTVVMIQPQHDRVEDCDKL